MRKKILQGKQADRHRRLQRQLRRLRLLAQGSVFKIDPSPQAPRASRRYMWTRKVNNKTVTNALSAQQYEVLKEAIEANREIEDVLHRTREISQQAILQRLADSPRKRRRKTS